MLVRVTSAGIGLLLTASLSAREMTVDLSAEAAEQARSTVTHELAESRDRASADAPEAPAWQSRGFVMDEVIATAEPVPLELPETTPTRPDLEDLLKLHRAARSLEL